MTGDERETKPASPAPEDPANPTPISSGDFPSLPISPIDSHSTAVIHVRPPVPPVPNLPTRRKIGKYGLIKEIGRGGMGVVYHAHQDDLNRDVALKVIPSGPDADQTEVARFQAEAETAANLHHPNIVPVYDVGTADGLSYLAMELIDGGSLFRLISRKPLEPIVAARLLEPVARAMHYAHAQGVIHRDLKPSNILLSSPEVSSGNPRHSPEGDMIPKITDFGLAKRLDRPLALTQTGLAVGTPHYMAPEQALGKSDQISPLTDVYALGAILYEMLTGHPPFGAGSSLETMQQVVSRKPVPPSSLQASIPRELEEICLKCLEKKPANRYQSALAVADALHHFQHRTEPPTILARTPLEPESEDSLWARQSREWYFWPVLALTVSLFVGLASWRITNSHWVAARNEMVEKERKNAEHARENDEKSRELLRSQIDELRFRNTLLLADQGDFDGFPASADTADQKTVLAAYRQQLLTPLGPIEFKAPGGRVWLLGRPGADTERTPTDDTRVRIGQTQIAGGGVSCSGSFPPREMVGLRERPGSVDCAGTEGGGPKTIRLPSRDHHRSAARGRSHHRLERWQKSLDARLRRAGDAGSHRRCNTCDGNHGGLGRLGTGTLAGGDRGGLDGPARWQRASRYGTVPGDRGRGRVFPDRVAFVGNPSQWRHPAF